jgi:hypothetical protein
MDLDVGKFPNSLSTDLGCQSLTSEQALQGRNCDRNMRIYSQDQLLMKQFLVDDHAGRPAITSCFVSPDDRILGQVHHRDGECLDRRYIHRVHIQDKARPWNQSKHRQ